METKEEKLWYLRTITPTPICAPCFDFTVDGDNHERRTIVVVPIVVEEKASGAFQFAWACSRAVSCKDDCCRYSYARKKRVVNGESPLDPFYSHEER